MCGGLVSKNFRTSPAGDRVLRGRAAPRAIKTGKEVLSEFLVRAFPARALTLFALARAGDVGGDPPAGDVRKFLETKPTTHLVFRLIAKALFLSLTPHASVDDNNEREGPN